MTVASGLTLSLACAQAGRVSGSARGGRAREGTHLADGAKDGEAEVLGAGLLGRDAADELGAERERLLAVEGGLQEEEGGG